MSATATDWQRANQEYLMAAVGRVAAALERHAGGDGDLAAAEARAREAAEALPAAAALDTLCTRFGLSPFERDVVLLLAGIELDGRFAERCAAAQTERRASPTFGLALAALPEAHWSALTPDSPLRRWRLVEITPGETLTTSPLRIDERVLHYLAGIDFLDERLRGLVEPVEPAGELPGSHAELAERIAGLLRESVWPLIQICGDRHTGTRAIAAAACEALGARLHALDGAVVPTAAGEREALARLWEREAALSGSVLLLVSDDSEPADNERAVLAFVEAVHGAILATGRTPLVTRRRPVIRFDARRPSAPEQKRLWRDVLGPLADELDDELDAVAAQFELGREGIDAAAAYLDGDPGDRTERATMLWDACRAQARPRLDDLAQRIDAVATWADLVLPDPERETLREIAIHVRRRATVYERWGFAAKSRRGLGVGALFVGPSGTGKTMAGEVLANELRLDLYRIDLSQVVSKYIGETEKNLRRVFDAADAGGAILLFDEADALFGKRSEVKDSHDRYANIEVSYLLQRMEAYRGLAILTTNMRDALDASFLRRLRFAVEFPFPDAAQRSEIWRRVFPPATPTEGLDFEKLAQLDVAGGNIRNIALGAAFLAADSGEPVRMAHLLRAARGEYAKLEKPLIEAEIGGWV